MYICSESLDFWKIPVGAQELQPLNLGVPTPGRPQHVRQVLQEDDEEALRQDADTRSNNKRTIKTSNADANTTTTTNNNDNK